MSRLSTHVLDTAKGRPAAGVPVELFSLTPQRTHVADAVTNADGRALLAESVPAGQYELVFDVAAHVGHTAFLTAIPIRFTIGDAAANYHVPLLLSPYGYTTYRGS